MASQPLLRDYQIDAVRKLRKGSILCGGVGSGKSRTALAYYYIHENGSPDFLSGGAYFPMNDPPDDLYIITTARKRDTFEWEKEMAPFLLAPNREGNLYSNKVIVDSWNNIHKYKNVKDAFFIFDEQRVVGRGVWVKSFLAIAKSNHWILLSATPGDTWQDYIPVFIANGFYKNRTQFNEEHVQFSRMSKYPKIERYFGTQKLSVLRDSLLVNMDFKRETVQHHEDVHVEYDRDIYRQIGRTRFNPYKNEPIINAAELCFLLRRVVNEHSSRAAAVLEIAEKHPRLIIFYNYDYELDTLRQLVYPAETVMAEWNGHQHQPIPETKRWVYLVQYSAGCEGWNCVKTDTILFYSANYSYKVMTQAAGRIDRLNTSYTDLYYYHLKSRAPIDLAIERALRQKKNFNETAFTGWKKEEKRIENPA